MTRQCECCEAVVSYTQCYCAHEKCAGCGRCVAHCECSMAWPMVLLGGDALGVKVG